MQDEQTQHSKCEILQAECVYIRVFFRVCAFMRSCVRLHGQGKDITSNMHVK